MMDDSGVKRRALEMLEMKQPPGMYMKTKATMTKCPAKNTAFTRKRSNCAIIDKNRADFLGENAEL
jgi:hypothetical protein